MKWSLLPLVNPRRSPAPYPKWRNYVNDFLIFAESESAPVLRHSWRRGFCYRLGRTPANRPTSEGAVPMAADTIGIKTVIRDGNYLCGITINVCRQDFLPAARHSRG